MAVRPRDATSEYTSRQASRGNAHQGRPPAEPIPSAGPWGRFAQTVLTRQQKATILFFMPHSSRGRRRFPGAECWPISTSFFLNRKLASDLNSGEDLTETLFCFYNYNLSPNSNKHQQALNHISLNMSSLSSPSPSQGWGGPIALGEWHSADLAKITTTNGPRGNRHEWGRETACKQAVTV